MIKGLLILATVAWGGFFSFQSLQTSLAYIKLYPDLAAEFHLYASHEVMMWMGAWFLMIAWLIRAARSR